MTKLTDEERRKFFATTNSLYGFEWSDEKSPYAHLSVGKLTMPPEIERMNSDWLRINRAEKMKKKQNRTEP